VLKKLPKSRKAKFEIATMKVYERVSSIQYNGLTLRQPIQDIQMFELAEISEF
jgi:hypothetical protein